MSGSGLVGIEAGQTVQEIGWDEDVDEALRSQIEAACGSELLPEDAQEVADVVVLWFREEDGDLEDALVDALTTLADNGTVWLLTPKSGQEGHIEPYEISDAAATAGLQSAQSISASATWHGSRLVAPKSGR